MRGFDDDGGPYKELKSCRVLEIETEAGQRIAAGAVLRYKGVPFRVRSIEIPLDPAQGEFRILLETSHGDFVVSVNSDHADRDIST